MRRLDQLIQLFESFHEAIYIVDRDRKILYFNPAASEISGYTKEDTVESYCYDNILNHVDDTGRNLCFEGCPLLDTIKYNRVEDHYVYLHHKQGHRVRVHVRAIPYEEDGEVVGAIEVFTDESTKNLLQETLAAKERLLLIDPLTGLFNRRYLDEKIGVELSSNVIHTYGVLFMDIDNFKMINDTYGHIYGDQVLASVAQTILLNLRPYDHVIRYGGEEIVAVLKDMDEIKVVKVAEMLRNMVSQSKPRDPRYPYKLSTSIGATLIKDQEALMDAIHRADQAMYQAKQLGKNQVVYA